MTLGSRLKFMHICKHCPSLCGDGHCRAPAGGRLSVCSACAEPMVDTGWGQLSEHGARSGGPRAFWDPGSGHSPPSGSTSGPPRFPQLGETEAPSPGFLEKESNWLSVNPIVQSALACACPGRVGGAFQAGPRFPEGIGLVWHRVCGAGADRSCAGPPKPIGVGSGQACASDRLRNVPRAAQSCCLSG